MTQLCQQAGRYLIGRAVRGAKRRFEYFVHPIWTSFPVVEDIPGPFRGSLTGPRAKNDGFSQCVAAHAIGAMQSATYFAGRKQSGH